MERTEFQEGATRNVWFLLKNMEVEVTERSDYYFVVVKSTVVGRNSIFAGHGSSRRAAFKKLRANINVVKNYVNLFKD